MYHQSLEIRFLVSGNLIEYQKKEMFRTSIKEGKHDSVALESTIESINPGDKIMTIVLKNGEYLSGTDEEYELRKVEGERKTVWGEIKSYHLVNSTLEVMERRSKKKRKKADEKKKSNDAEAEKLLSELQQKYKKLRKKDKMWEKNKGPISL